MMEKFKKIKYLLIANNILVAVVFCWASLCYLFKNTYFRPIAYKIHDELGVETASEYSKVIIDCATLLVQHFFYPLLLLGIISIVLNIHILRQLKDNNSSQSKGTV